MNLHSTLRIPPHVMARPVGEETVILDLQSGTYYSLDTVGARLWTLLAEGRTVDGACEVLLGEFEIGREVLEGDVLRLVSALLERGLVRAG